MQNTVGEPFNRSPRKARPDARGFRPTDCLECSLNAFGPSRTSKLPPTWATRNGSSDNPVKAMTNLARTDEESVF